MNMENLTQHYIQLYRTSKDQLAEWVETLSHKDRMALREDLFKKDIPTVRGLSFDYQTHQWIF